MSSQLKVIHGAGAAVHPLHVRVGHLAVTAGHLQGTVAQQPLQAEDIAPVAQEIDGGGVAQGMGRAAHPAQSGLAPVAHHHHLHPVYGHGPAVPGEEDLVDAGHGGPGPVVRDVAPDLPGRLAAQGHGALLVALAPHPQCSLLDGHVGQAQPGELGDPQAGIQQHQQHGVIAVTDGLAGVDHREELL